MEKYIYTYQTKNNINDKTYIGYHSTLNLNDGYIGCGVKSNAYAKSVQKYGKKSAFIDAVVVYGYKNFTKEILSFHESIEEAREEEKFLVNKEWVSNNNNYNILLGGGGNNKISNSDKYKDEIINDYINGMYNVQLAKKYKICFNNIKLITSKINRIEPIKPLLYIKKYGKKIIEEIQEKRRTIPDYNFLKIKNEYGMSRETASKICLGIKKLNIINPIKEKKIHTGPHKDKKIYFYDQEYIIENTVTEFCKNNNIKQSNFQEMLAGRTLNANGFSLNKKEIIILQKNGELFPIREPVSYFCKRHNINASSIYLLKTKKISQTKGYKIYYER